MYKESINGLLYSGVRDQLMLSSSFVPGFNVEDCSVAANECVKQKANTNRLSVLSAAATVTSRNH